MSNSETLVTAIENAKKISEEYAQKYILVPLKEANMIIALLKEQEAVEPRKENDSKPQPWTSWWYVCGDCGQEIEYHDRFCRWCGRSVKWDE